MYATNVCLSPMSMIHKCSVVNLRCLLQNFYGNPVISKQEMNHLRAVFNQIEISNVTIYEIFSKLFETIKELNKKLSSIRNLALLADNRVFHKWKLLNFAKKKRNFLTLKMILQLFRKTFIGKLLKRADLIFSKSCNFRKARTMTTDLSLHLRHF